MSFEEKLPDMLKVSRVLTIRKAGKNKMLMSSYRPIHQMSDVEKISMEHLKEHLLEFIKKNAILHPNQQEEYVII